MLTDNITVQDVKDYLGIDYVDEATDRRLTSTISVANSYLESAIVKPLPADPRVGELGLIVIADLYDNHEMTDKVSGNVRRMVHNLSLQLRLEARSDQ